MCMCGMLAAEYETLPEPMCSAVIRFFDEHRTWLAHVLSEGLRDKTLNFAGPEDEVAQGILSTVEGAMLVAGPMATLFRSSRRVRLFVANLSS